MDSSVATTAPSRDEFMKRIAFQAANVRRTFEAHPSKRKHAVSSATAAAAQHMASLNRKRKFENHLAIRANSAEHQNATPAEHIWNKTSHTFHSPIAAFTRPDMVRTVSSNIGNGSSKNGGAANRSCAQQQQQPAAAPGPVPTNEAAPRVSDGIVLKATPHDITVTYNDVVCGKGKTTSSLVGNQRYKVWVNLHKDVFAKALYEEERRNIACAIVNAVTTSLPQGRFLSLDIHSGLWYDVGYERAVGITMETLMAETGMMRQRGMMPPVARRASIPRVFTSKAA
ncbi:hypothetical protein ACHAXR_010072 [Thalassiosira sp. AJA248-18]